ncbi:unnamed protein product, partial [Ectocarpus sp. 8 AP-2014]
MRRHRHQERTPEGTVTLDPPTRGGGRDVTLPPQKKRGGSSCLPSSEQLQKEIILGLARESTSSFLPNTGPPLRDRPHHQDSSHGLNTTQSQNSAAASLAFTVAPLFPPPPAEAAVCRPPIGAGCAAAAAA